MAVSLAAGVVLTLAFALSITLFALKQTRQGYEQVMAMLNTVDPNGRMRKYAEELKRRAVVDDQLKLAARCTISNQNLSAQAQFSPVGNSFAVITREGAVSIFDTDGRQMREVVSPELKVTAIAYAPDGKSLLTGTRQGKALLWDLATGKSRQVFAKLERPIRHVLWLPNPDRCVVAYDKAVGEYAVFIIRLADGESLVSFSSQWQNCTYQAVAASADGKMIGSLGIHGKERAGYLLDSAQCQIKAKLYDDDYPSGPLSIGIAPDNNTVAVGYAPNHLSLWDSASQKELRLVKAHSNWVVS